MKSLSTELLASRLDDCWQLLARAEAEGRQLTPEWRDELQGLIEAYESELESR